MSNSLGQSTRTSDLTPSGAGVAEGVFPSGIAWVDELMGGWRRDRPTALVTYGYRIMYWRLVEQIARKFVALGGQVDFVGSPLPRQYQPFSMAFGTRTPHDTVELRNDDRPVIEVLRQVAASTRIHFPPRVANLRSMLPWVASRPPRLIVVSAMDWLVFNEQPRITNQREIVEVTHRLTGELQQLASALSASLIVLAQHDIEEIPPKRGTTRWLIRRTIFEATEVLGAFVLLIPNPLFEIGVWAYGGRLPGKCSRVTLTPTEEGWEKYVRKNKHGK